MISAFQRRVKIEVSAVISDTATYAIATLITLGQRAGVSITASVAICHIYFS